MKRVLFDHCVPKPLRRWLPGCEVRTCFEQGWATLSNGRLLAADEAVGFEVFLTADQNLRYQQDLVARRIAIIELPTNRFSHMPLLAPALEHFNKNCGRVCLQSAKGAASYEPRASP